MVKTFALAALLVGSTVALESKKLSSGLATCPPGTWRKHNFAAGAGQNCFSCPPGTFAEGTNASKCTDCMAGRFSKAFGAIHRSTCTTCAAGSYWPLAGASATRIGATDDCRTAQGAECACGSSDCEDKRICVTCPAGEYQNAAAARSCEQCPPGTFRETEGGTALETSCTKCDMTKFDFIKSNAGEYIYGATKIEEACKLRPVDCIMEAWGPYDRCSAACGGGTQKATRTIKIEGAFGGTTCANMDVERTRSCHTTPCGKLDKRFPSYEEMQDGGWWTMQFDADAADSVIAPGMHAECRWQKDHTAGPFGWIPNAQNVIVHEGTSTILAAGEHVEGWCCQATTAEKRPIGKPFCYQTEVALQKNFDVYFWGSKYKYDEDTGKMCMENGSSCAQFKPVFVHKQLCKEMSCVVEEHQCSKYICAPNSHNQALYKDGTHKFPNYCPNQGHGNCQGTHKSLRVTHSMKEEVGGHFCSVTDPAANKCECYCHDIYRNMQRSPTFGQAVQMQAKAVFEANRKKCVLPAAGKGAAYQAFSAGKGGAEFEFNGQQYAPAGPCPDGGCWVVRGSMYSSNCMVDAENASPFLKDTVCSGFGSQSCSGSTHSSQCGVQLGKNTATPAAFFRVMNNKGGCFTANQDDGLYFKDASGKTLLYINPAGKQFNGENDYSYFGDVPEETDYVFLKGGGNGRGCDYSGVTVAFFTC